MSDDLTIKEPADGKRINRHEPYEVNYWKKKYGCTKEQLFAALDAVGVMAVDVEAYLKKNKK
jgi:Protein of unknown function (DUF3606)